MTTNHTNRHRRPTLTFPIWLAAALAACGGGGGGQPAGSPVLTGFDVGSGTVLAGSSTQVRVTVTNDPANRGVSWSVSCAQAPCGSVSPSASASGVWVTYTAPTAVPAADLAVTVTAASVSSPSQQASGPLTVPALAVSVDPQSDPGMEATTTAQFTATVNYPAQASKGVSWAVQCSASDCGKVAPATSASGAAVTYTAPASPPAAELTVMVTASSVSSPSTTGSAAVTVPAITVAMTPRSALVPMNATQQFTGSVTSDPSGGDVDWSVVQGALQCPSGCGSFSPSPTTSGAATTYTGPAALPTSATVTVTATSATDHTKSATATVALSTGTVQIVPIDLFFTSSKACQHPAELARLTNVGKTPLTISAMTFAGANPGGYSQSNDCGGSVAPGGSCQITVGCGYPCRPAVLLVADNSADSPQTIHLQGGVARYQVTAAARTALARQATVATPPPRGDAQVGTRVLYLRDPNRIDPYVSDGARRELPVRLWYPTAVADRCVAAPYTSPQVWSYFSALLGSALPRVSTHSCLDSPLASGAHPVVFLEHGFTGTASDYTYLSEDLASRGYLVAAVDHTHEATAVEFPDGRLEKSVFGSHLTGFTRADADALGMAVAVRLDDLRFTLDELARLNAAPGSDLAGRLDLTRVALVGHSLGGLTTLSALESEPRFKAGVLLDGLTPAHLAKAIQRPVLPLVVGPDHWSEHDCRLWDALQAPRVAVQLPRAEHVALSDAVWLLRGTVMAGDPNPDRAIAAVRDYVAAFLHANLNESAAETAPAAWLPDYPGAVVATQRKSVCR